MKKIRVVLIFAAIALVPSLMFVLFGYTGHDFRAHQTSWMELRQAWLEGLFNPGWDGLANFKLGQPSFCFYPPLSQWLGAMLALVLPTVLVPAAFTWVALIVSGLTMFAASEVFVAEEDRLKAAVLYMLNPYLLLIATIRFAASELLAQAWIPLVVLFFYRAVSGKSRRPVLWLGGALGLCWLTNIPLAIASAYALLAVAAIVAIKRRSLIPLLHFAAAECISILLAAFYMVPAYMEQKWISASGVLRSDFREFFIFASFSHQMRFKLICWLIACAEIALILFASMRWRQAGDRVRQTFVELGIVAFLFQIPLTIPLWEHLFKLWYVDFPFRFLALMGAALPMVLLAKTSRRKILLPAYVTMGLLVILVLLGYSVGRPSASVTAFPGFREYSASIHDGYPGLPEYVPVGATQQIAPPALAPIAIAGDGPAGECATALLSAAAWDKSFSVDSEQPCNVRLAIFDYPYWHAVDERGDSLVISRNAEGLLLVAVPPGRHIVHLRFRVSSPLRTASWVITSCMVLLFALTFLAEICTRIRRRKDLAGTGNEESANTLRASQAASSRDKPVSVS
ncbi:MAG: hypothetical protein ABSF70_09325 [Terracidiphilus sp.]|jgi:hypothetical protein